VTSYTWRRQVVIFEVLGANFALVEQLMLVVFHFSSFFFHYDKFQKTPSKSCTHKVRDARASS